MQLVPITLPQRRLAIAMLVVATVFWGMGFAWAKNVGEATNAAAGVPAGSTLGPILMLSLRFLIGAGVWAMLFPQSRRGWSRRTVGYGLIIGLVMCTGLILQHLGLDQTSEAVAAFLTNLTVVIVPLLVIAYTFRVPPVNLLIAAVVALGGIYLLTGADLGGLGQGELYVMLCAVVFSFAILSLNVFTPRDDSYRLTLAMFLCIGVCCGVAAILSPGFGDLSIRQLASPSTLAQLAALTILCTLVAFGLMVAFQPRVDPTRAAIVYLFEPIVAAVFASLTEPGATMSRPQIAGAGLILLANIFAELKWSRRNATPQGKDLD